VPDATPVTLPVAEPTIATPVLLLNHVPPDVVFASVDIDPSHTLNVPVIAAGLAFTVIVSFLEHPVARVYVILVVPVVTPVSIPEHDPIDATPVALLTQVPPAGVVETVVVKPVHTEDDVVKDTGIGLTVNVAVEKQPVVVSL